MVAALDNITKEGYAPLEQVKDILAMQIRNDKKAEKIIGDLKSKNLNSLAGYAEVMKAQVDSAKFVSFSSPSIAGVGYEPVLSGLAPVSENGKARRSSEGIERGVCVYGYGQNRFGTTVRCPDRNSEDSAELRLSHQ